MKLLRFIAISAAIGLIIGFIDNITNRDLAAIIGISLILAGLVVAVKGTSK